MANDQTKWNDDLPEDWDDAPEDPPTPEGQDGSEIVTERLMNGVVVRERGTEDEDGCHIYSDYSIEVA